MSVTFQVEKTAKLLSDLLGRAVTAKVGQPPAATYDPAIVASYAVDSGDLVAVCVCDLEFALNCGAALCLIPAVEAASNAKAKRLDPVLFENSKEILNICAQLFGSSNTQRVKLASVYSKFAEAPAGVKDLIKNGRVRREVQVSIAGYGTGRIAVFC